MKAVLNPRYEIVEIRGNPGGEKICTIKRRKNVEDRIDSEKKNGQLKV